MDIEPKKGYGFLIKWIIGLGDLVLLNLFFAFLNRFCGSAFFADRITEGHKIGEIFLLITLSYFITTYILPIRIASNIIFFDKIVQHSVSFVTLYIILFTVGLTMFDIMHFTWGWWIVIYLILCVVYSSWHILYRTIIKLYRSKGYNFKRVVIIGRGLNGLNVYHELSSSDYGYKVFGFFDDDFITNRDTPLYLGEINKVESFCLEQKVDEIYCTLPSKEETKIIQLLNFSEKNTIRFYLVPEFYKYIKRQLVLGSLQTMPILGIRQEPLQLFQNRIIKRFFDLSFSLFILLTFFPILYVILGTIIKLSSKGPILFKQKRTGLEGKVFYCYKFRSMRLNNDSDLKITNAADPRITPIGRWMRKFSIDETPQFINVVLGNMSVVGPRPHMLQQTELYRKLIDKFMIRHLIKPGITGWAQISGYRGETDTIEKMEGRFKRDIWYLENWTFFLDLKIIFVTIVKILESDDNVY